MRSSKPTLIAEAQLEKFDRIFQNYDELKKILTTLPYDHAFYKNSLLTPKILKNHLEKQIENYKKLPAYEYIANVLSAFSKLQDALRTCKHAFKKVTPIEQHFLDVLNAFSKLESIVDPSASQYEQIKNGIDQKQEINARLEAEDGLKAEFKSSVKNALQIDDVETAKWNVTAKEILLDIAKREIREVVERKTRAIAEPEIKKSIERETKAITDPKIKENMEHKIKAFAERKINKIIKRQIKAIEQFGITPAEDPEIREAVEHKNRADNFLIDAHTRKNEIQEEMNERKSKNEHLNLDEKRQKKEGDLSDEMQKILQDKVTELKNTLKKLESETKRLGKILASLTNEKGEESQAREIQISKQIQKNAQIKINLEFELNRLEKQLASFNVMPDDKESSDFGYKNNLSQTFFYDGNLSNDKAPLPTKKITNNR